MRGDGRRPAIQIATLNIDLVSEALAGALDQGGDVVEKNEMALWTQFQEAA
jgi:hypothetical protein